MKSLIKINRSKNVLIAFCLIEIEQIDFNKKTLKIIFLEQNSRIIHINQLIV